MAYTKDEYQRVIEAEVNATIKLVMATMEDLAAMDPRQASYPHDFNARRNAVIRKLWNMSKECIRYGAQSVHPQ